MLPVAVQIEAQSRLRRMQVMSFSICFSARHASAQAVQVSTQAKQASMQRLIASAWLICSGWEWSRARTAVIGTSFDFGPPQANSESTLIHHIGSTRASSPRIDGISKRVRFLAPSAAENDGKSGDQADYSLAIR